MAAPRKKSKNTMVFNERAFDRANNYDERLRAGGFAECDGAGAVHVAAEALVVSTNGWACSRREHIIKTFDSWGHDIGKNMYSSKPANGTAGRFTCLISTG